MILKYDFDWNCQITNLGTRQSELNLAWCHLKQKIPVIFTEINCTCHNLIGWHRLALSYASDLSHLHIDLTILLEA